MICAYCESERKGTSEHIISKCVLNLFPECSLTFDGVRNKVYPSDPAINDVCANCNNAGLSYIDDYALEIIQKYFLKEYQGRESIGFNYEYTKLQKVLLKYSYNVLRSEKKDTRFFDKTIRNYLLNEQDDIPLKNVVILAGLAVNVSPLPNTLVHDEKIRWTTKPLLLDNSIVENDSDGCLSVRKEQTEYDVKNCVMKCLFRIGSFQAVVLCFDGPASEMDIELLEIRYPYVALNTRGFSVLSRCTSAITYHLFEMVDVTWGQSIIDGYYQDKNIDLEPLLI